MPQSYIGKYINKLMSWGLKFPNWGSFVENGKVS